MKALILAAGEGRRMRPLTLMMPKPWVSVGGLPLIVRQIENLKRAGITEIVVNTAYGARLLEALLGDGHEYGVSITYSREGTSSDDALETLGGIVKALPLLSDNDEPFIVVAADIATDYDYRALIERAETLSATGPQAHLVLVENPDWHPNGDMGLVEGFIDRTQKTHTFSSLGLYHPSLFTSEPQGRAKLFPWLFEKAGPRGITGEVFSGFWANVGNPDQLKAANAHYEETL